MRILLAPGLSLLLSQVAIAADSTPAGSAEPAGMLLMLLGLLALLLGMRNLHDLRTKRMTPPPLKPPLARKDDAPISTQGNDY